MGALQIYFAQWSQCISRIFLNQHFTKYVEKCGKTAIEGVNGCESDFSCGHTAPRSGSLLPATVVTKVRVVFK